MKTLTQATPGQIRQITRVGFDAIEKVLEELGLDKKGAQRVHSRGDEFAMAIRETAMASLRDLSVTDKFKDEEVESSYTYPDGYKVKPIVEQVKILRELFPKLGSVDESLAERDLPLNAEGWFAIPRWETVSDTYGEAVEKVLAMIKSERRFYNYREGELGPQYLRQHAQTVKVFQTLADRQNNHDILVVPTQFGLKHRGKSVRRARELFQVNEFGLGAFAVGIMLLTHPEHEVQWKQLHVDCAGDEFAPDAGGRFIRAPIFFFFDDGRVRFGARQVDDPLVSFGSASGFLPQ